MNEVTYRYDGVLGTRGSPIRIIEYRSGTPSYVWLLYGWQSAYPTQKLKMYPKNCYGRRWDGIRRDVTEITLNDIERI